MKANRTFFLFTLLIILLVGGYFWWRAGFTLDVSRFFAAEQVQVELPGGTVYQHGSTIRVQWSSNATSCQSNNGWISTGGLPSGDRTSSAVNACVASGGQISITCTWPGGVTYTTTRNFTINTASCPTAPRCGDGACNGSENATSCPADCAVATPTYTCTNTTGQFCYTGSGGCPSTATTGSGTCQTGICCRPAGVSTAPTATLSADRATVPPGGNVALTWSSTGASSCATVSGTFSTGGAPSGTAVDTVSPSTTATSVSYRVACTGTGGTTNSNVVTVAIAGSAVTPSVAPSSSPSASGSCAGMPIIDQRNGVTVCLISSTFASDRCSQNSAGRTLTYTARIINNQPAGSENIYSKPAIFFSPTATCGAHASNPGNAAGLVSGTRSLSPGQAGDVTYRFTADSCGSWQLDDTWGPGDTVFVIGKVIDTGVNCATPSTPPTTPPPTTPPPTTTVTPPPLQCVAEVSQANISQIVDFQASGGTGAYAWYAPGGTGSANPVTGSGPVFATAYDVTGFKTVTVGSGGNQATCTVTIVAPVVVEPLACTPAGQTVASGQSATINATDGVSPYAWSAPGGSPASASAGTSFTTAFTNTATTSQTFPVTVTDANEATATCNVTVAPPGVTVSPTPSISASPSVSPSVSPSISPSPSPSGSPSSNPDPDLSIRKTVRNVTQNGTEADSVTASPTNTVEFIIRVSSNGTGTARQVTVRDTLPGGLTYQAGSTTVDNTAAADGVIGSGLALGDMVRGRTIFVRFLATVASDAFFSNGTTALTDIAYARAQNVSEVSDTAVVSVVKGTSLGMSLMKLGRNVTRNQTGEHSPVYSDPAQTIEFIVRVRNTSTSTITNVTVRDALPPRITLVAGTVRVNGVTASDALTTAGINIGSLADGQEAVVLFSGRVANASEFAIGTTTLTNTAFAVADGVPQLTAQLPVIVTRTGPPVTQVPTGPGESTVMALIISSLITLLYAGYTSTDSFRRREAQGLADRADNHDSFDFKR